MKKCVLCLFVLFTSLSAYPQQSPVKKLVEESRSQGVEFVSQSLFSPSADLYRDDQAFLEQGQLLTLDQEALNTLYEERPPAITFSLPYLDDNPIHIELIRHEILAPGFNVSTPSQPEKSFNYQPAAYYQGVIVGAKHSVVAITVTKDGVLGVLEDHRQGNMVLGKMRDGSELYVLYRMADVRELPAFSCGTEDLDPVDSPYEGLDQLPQINTRNLDNCVGVYLECEYDMYLENGSVQATVDFMTGLFNVVATLYDNEEITTNISEVFVWDTPDPYPTGSTVDALYAFRDNRPNYNGDLAHLVSRGDPAGGGVAWIDQLCGSYGYAYSYIYSWYNQFPSYSWSVNVIAHEMGHNVGSRHTHDCVWNGNNTAIDGCGYDAGYGGCPGPIPEGGGTIMSYCHLLSIGINFNYGFGPQPGDLMRSRVTNAGCLNSCDNCDLIVTVDATDVDCAGGSSGEATANPSGGTSPYEYNWSNGATTQTISDLTTGSYSVTVTDVDGCEETGSVTISEPAPLGLDFIVTTESSPGANDASIDLTVSGGTTPYQFTWSNGATTEDLSNLSAGTYTVTVTDANNCVATGSVTVNACTLALNLSGTDALCFDSPSGSATVTASGGTSPYTYLWSNGASTQTISDIPAGDYSVTVTEADGCEETGTITISEPDALMLDFQVTTESSPGANDASIDLTVSGGTTPYQYFWSTGATTEDIYNLADDTYSVTVTDANDCEIIDSVTVSSCSLSVSLSGTDVTCYGLSTGSATASASGGNSPYSYLWSNGSTTQTISDLPAGNYSVTVTEAGGCEETGTITISEPDALALDFEVTTESAPGANDALIDLTASGGTTPYQYLWSTGDTTEDLDNLAAGTYAVTVTDASECVKTGSVIISSCSLTLDLSGTDASCYGSSTGSATAYASGGASPYAYLWSNGVTTQTIQNLSEGSYTVTVTDDANCSQTGTVVINQPDELSLSTNVTNSSGAGASDGAIDLSVSGGTAGYSYLWSNGATTQDIDGLSAGDYSVTVTDLNGCQKSDTYTVGQDQSCSSLVDQFPYAESFEDGWGLWVQESNDEFDWERYSGSTPTNGTGPNGAFHGNWYVYAEANGHHNQTAGLVSPCFDFSQLIGAECTFAFQMRGNHQGMLSAEISTDDGATWETLGSVAGNYGRYWYLATIELTPYTGKGSIKLRFNATIGSGNKSDIALDYFNISGEKAPCVSPTLQVSSTDASCHGADDGTATVVASGGTPPYVSYEWSNGMKGSSISGLATGNYEVTVTDSDNCFQTASVAVGEPVAMELSFDVTDASGPGVADGAIDLTVQNGTSPLAFEWSNGETTEDIGGLVPGVYGVSVIDSGDCDVEGTATVEVEQACVPVPHLASFEYNNNPLDGWIQSNDDDFDWSRNSGRTPTWRTGPLSAYHGNYYLYTEASGNGGKTAILESPCFDLRSVNSALLLFVYHMYGNNMGTMDIDLSTDDGQSWVNIWSLSGNQGDYWYFQSIDLSAYAGQEIKLRLVGKTNSGNPRGDMAIDPIYLYSTGSLPVAFEEKENEHDIQSALHIHPNPNNGLFKVQIEQDVLPGETAELQVFDSFGKLCKTITVPTEQKQVNLEVDLQELPNGLYAVTYKKGDELIVRKMLIQH